MKALRTFVTTADLLHTYRQGEDFPRAGITPAPEVVRALVADGLIEQDKPEPEEDKPLKKTARKK